MHARGWVCVDYLACVSERDVCHPPWMPKTPLAMDLIHCIITLEPGDEDYRGVKHHTWRKGLSIKTNVQFKKRNACGEMAYQDGKWMNCECRGIRTSKSSKNKVKNRFVSFLDLYRIA